MTAAMLVLEPIFGADLPPEQYACRPGRNAQQAVVEVEELLFRGRPEVVNTPPTQRRHALPFFQKLPPCLAVLDTASLAGGRTLGQLGHGKDHRLCLPDHPVHRR
jgi:hypothetical protein